MSSNNRLARDILVLDAKDNVAVCLRDLVAGEKVVAASGGETMAAIALDAIPAGHKICMRKIEEGAQVVKYGEIIGKATASISVGQHVHVHNVTD